MKGVRLVTRHLVVCDLPPRYAAAVAAFQRGNRDFHSPWEPSRPDSYYSVREQRRLMRRERRSEDTLRFWLMLRDEQTAVPSRRTAPADDSAPTEPCPDGGLAAGPPVAVPPCADPGLSGRPEGYRWPRVIGSISLSAIVRGGFLSCFLGYKIDDEYSGRGLMREALVAVLDYAFGRLGLHRVEANIMPANESSTALVTSLGFVGEGLSRAYLKINGVWEDHRHWVMHAERWSDLGRSTRAAHSAAGGERGGARSPFTL